MSDAGQKSVKFREAVFFAPALDRRKTHARRTLERCWKHRQEIWNPRWKRVESARYRGRSALDASDNGAAPAPQGQGAVTRSQTAEAIREPWGVSSSLRLACIIANENAARKEPMPLIAVLHKSANEVLPGAAGTPPGLSPKCAGVGCTSPPECSQAAGPPTPAPRPAPS